MVYRVEGLDLDVEVEGNDNKEVTEEQLFTEIRKMSGMNRKEFSEWLGIPYRTMTDWELGNRKMPDYLLRLVAYKVKMELLNKKEKD